MQRIGSREEKYVREVLTSQYSAAIGSDMVRRLEEAFAAAFGVKYAIAHTNGTSTMHSALVAAGVGPGDEVIVPPLTMSSTSLAVLQANAVPVFADIDPLTWTMDPVSVAKVITSRTRAIIPVALYGLAPDMDPLMALAAQHNLLVLEDDAQCFLGEYRGRTVGSIGHAASFSFQRSKHLTCGEGGIIITNDAELADGIRRFSCLGYAAVGANKSNITKKDIQDPAYARHVTMGFNYRMPELCAAVALAQTERIHELVALRVEVARLFAAATAGCAWLTPQKIPDGTVHSYWSYVCLMSLHAHERIGWGRFREKYLELGGDGIYGAWRLSYLEPFFLDAVAFPLRCQGKEFATQGYLPGLCPHAESVQPRLLQFRGNYIELDLAQRKADALAATIRYFEGRW